MKLSKIKMLLTIWAGLFAGCLMFAQAQPSPETKANNSAKTMAKQLGLSPEQTTKVSEIFLEVITKQEELKQSDVTPAERKKANQVIAKLREDGLKGTLTEEQWKKLQEIREKQRDRQQAKNQQG